MAGRTAGEGHTLVYLARHGQTPLNESDVLRCLADPPLDAALGDPDAVPQDNGCFNTLEWRGGSWTVLSVNELPADP
jgi:hypothetical protein